VCQSKFNVDGNATSGQTACAEGFDLRVTTPQNCPTSMTSTTSTTSTTGSSTRVSVTLSSTAPPISMAAIVGVPDNDNTVIIAGAVGGSIGTLLLAGFIAFCVCRARKSRPVQQVDRSTVLQPWGQYDTMPAPSSTAAVSYDVGTARHTSEYGPFSASAVHGEYGAAPPVKDAPSLHGPISAAEACGEYASMRADMPSSKYERWSDNGAAPKSHYVGTAAEFTAGLPSGSNYGRM
jgi:hypothetical protein